MDRRPGSGLISSDAMDTHSWIPSTEAPDQTAEDGAISIGRHWSEWYR